MRSVTSSTSTKTASLDNTMSTNLLNSYQSTKFNNQSNTSDWESLRKQARQLENEIDSKLVSFSKLCSNFSSSSYTATSPNSLARTNSGHGSPGPNSSSSDLIFLTLSNEIEEALKKLTTLNGKMSDSLNNENVISSSGTVHTLQRHRDILRDYSHEYEKTKRNIQSYKEREMLLHSSMNRHQNETNNLNNRRMENNNGQTSFYMKEFDHLKSSHSLIDQQIEIAELTKENLQSQRQSMKMIQQRMNNLVHKFPLINNLVKKVKLKKRKDTLILGSVISFCLFLMLVYIF